MTSLSSLVSLSVVGLCCQCCCLFVPCLSFPAFLCPLFRMLFGFPLGTTLGPCSYSGFTLIASCVVARGIVVDLCCLSCCYLGLCSYLATLERSLTRTFVLLFIRFRVICQVLGGIPDNARVMGCTCANSPSLPTVLFVYYSE